MWPSFLTSNVNPWRVLGITAGAAVLAMLLYVRAMRLELEKAQVVYTHPAVTTHEKKNRTEGAVRIVTRIIREPGGREETVREETRGPVTETTDVLSVSTPVLDVPRRWVVGGGLDTFRSYTFRDATVYGGLTLGGRLDLVARVTGGGRVGALVMWRF